MQNNQVSVNGSIVTYPDVFVSMPAPGEDPRNGARIRDEAMMLAICHWDPGFLDENGE